MNMKFNVNKDWPEILFLHDKKAILMESCDLGRMKNRNKIISRACG